MSLPQQEFIVNENDIISAPNLENGEGGCLVINANERIVVRGHLSANAAWNGDGGMIILVAPQIIIDGDGIITSLPEEGKEGRRGKILLICQSAEIGTNRIIGGEVEIRYQNMIAGSSDPEPTLILEEYHYE